MLTSIARRLPSPRAVALAVLFAAAARLLTLPATGAPDPPPPIVTIHGYADERWTYQPLAFVDDHTSIGPSLSPDDGGAKLLVVTDGKTVHVLRTLAQELAAQFLGLRIAGDQVVWLEQTAGADGQGDAVLEVADWRTGSTRELTRDVGEYTFFNAQDDLVVEDGRVSWAASAPGDSERTEIRSIALAGGPVDRRTVDGAWQQIGGSWLVTATTGGAERTRMVDWRSGKRIDAEQPPGGLVSCARVWCRAVVLGAASSTRIDVFDLAGKRRKTAVSGRVTAVLNDVALLDRWEVYGRSTSGDPNVTAMQVLLYDVDTGRLVVVADGADQITGRDGFVWWSTGQGDYVTWHMVDLRALH